MERAVSSDDLNALAGNLFRYADVLVLKPVCREAISPITPLAHLAPGRSFAGYGLVREFIAPKHAVPLRRVTEGGDHIGEEGAWLAFVRKQ